MEMTPNQVRSQTFSTVRKGWDPSEVAAFLGQVAEALEQAQNHSTAMEARARAAVAKLQDVMSAEATDASPGAPAPAPLVEPTPVAAAVPTPPAPTDDEREMISRTLLLAQRAADDALAQARHEAEAVLQQARDAARREGADERQRVRDEVDALSARRGFLQSDVEHLEQFLVDQRDRLRSTAATLVDLAERVPDGLGQVRPPLLSAGDEPLAIERTMTSGGTSGGASGPAPVATSDAAPTGPAPMDGESAGDEESDADLAGLVSAVDEIESDRTGDSPVTDDDGPDWGQRPSTPRRPLPGFDPR